MAVSQERVVGAEEQAEAVASDFLVVLDFPAGLVFRVGAAVAAHLLYREVREKNSKSQ